MMIAIWIAIAVIVLALVSVIIVVITRLLAFDSELRNVKTDIYKLYETIGTHKKKSCSKRKHIDNKKREFLASIMENE